mmetsp:Transcript_45502/g.66434  ORF Transcript_45502/g.66434 Transcript_45502/m.66434 type:complete len:356 (-) Transcript_45502:50-1117(-)
MNSFQARLICVVAVLAVVDAFTGAPLGLGRRAASRSALQMLGSALIVQNKGGGHGEIGFHLAKILKEEKGCDAVTILQDGGEPSGKLPFSRYGELEALGCEVIWCDVKGEGVARLAGKKFDYVFDNWSKDEATVKPIADMAKAQNVETFAYVSSGGMYKYPPTLPITEDADAKETGQREVEKYLDAAGLPWTAFRPQYIYGPATNKRDYLDYFVDRISRDQPVPIPHSGEQLASVTHAYDVAAMLAAATANPKAAKQVFNCGTDAYLTYNEIARQIGKALGKEARLVHYDPAQCPDLKFPFRPQHFFVGVGKAMRELGWAPKHNLIDDLSAFYLADYKALGKDAQAMDFPADPKA